MTVVEFTFTVSALRLTEVAVCEVAATAGPLGGVLVGAGVPVRLGSALILRSLPCASTIALGNVASFVSIAVGNRLFARAKMALTSEEASVESVQLY